MFKKYSFSCFLFVVLSFSATAHQGHDHSHPLAGVVHLLWLTPILVGVALLVREYIQLNKPRNNAHPGK